MTKDEALDEIIFALRTIQDERCTTKAEVEYIQNVIDFTNNVFEKYSIATIKIRKDMTKEEKQLLLKDLCARLPYGVICTDNRHGDSRIFNVDIEDESVYYTDFDEYGLIENCKPYLRPMSSMTEKEKKKLKAKTCPNGTGYFDEKYLLCPINHYGEQISYEFMQSIIDWLNAHHFDYRGLIPMGLALEAPGNMYKNE